LKCYSGKEDDSDSNLFGLMVDDDYSFASYVDRSYDEEIFDDDD
jgi:hypothetical protein